MRTLLLLTSLLIAGMGCATLGGTQRSAEAARGKVAWEKTSIHQSNVALWGTLTDLATGEPLLFGNVAVYRDDQLLAGMQTDFDGNFSFHLPNTVIVEGASYRVEFSYVGYRTVAASDLFIAAGGNYRIRGALVENIITCGIPYHWGFEIPVYQQDNLTSGQTFTSDQIRRSPIRN